MVMNKKLLISSLAVGGMLLGAPAAQAASFFLDTFDSGSQSLVTGQGRPDPARNNLTGLPGTDVLGETRKVELDLLQNDGNLSTAARARVIPKRPDGRGGFLSISNGSQVDSTTTITYDANNTTINGSGNNGNGLVDAGLGNLTATGIDGFGINILSIDLSTELEMIIVDTNGETATVSSGNQLGPGLQIFKFDQFLDNNMNLDLASVSYIQFRVSGDPDYDVTLDFIEGIEIPEPSTIIGSSVALLLGTLSTRKKKKSESIESV